MNDPQPKGHMASHIERRKFLATLGSAAAWPLAARAQQTAMPVVGFFYSGTLTDVPHFVTAFRQGLKEAGFLRRTSCSSPPTR
jgi:putative tryptophan/tyrosine transport system substrate-binding protein